MNTKDGLLPLHRRYQYVLPLETFIPANMKANVAIVAILVTISFIFSCFVYLFIIKSKLIRFYAKIKDFKLSMQTFNVIL